MKNNLSSLNNYYYLGDYSNIQIANYLRKMQQENTHLQQELNQKNKIIEEIKEWLDEYYKSNEKWYNTELSPHDKEYYREIYLDTDFLITKFKDKIEELEKGNEDNE